MKSKPLAIELLTRWQRRLDPDSREFTAATDYCELAREMLACGMPLQALEVVEEGVQLWSDDLALGQMRGMALARSGASVEASEQLENVVARLRQLENPDSYLLEESIGVLARTEKDFGCRTDDPENRRSHFHRAIELYDEAYRRTGGYWSGINVATLCNLVGRHDDAIRIAGEIRQKCLERLAKLNVSDNSTERYWVLATLGEAALNLQDWSAAEHWYRQAAVVAERRYGDLQSSSLHVELLLTHFGQDLKWKDDWLPLPVVAVFTGHMIDDPDRQHQRFPQKYERQVRDAIVRWIDENDVAIGYASAACGSDILFHEVLQERGGESYVILPFQEEAFIETSVATAGDPKWIERFWSVADGAAGTIRAGREQTEQGPLHYRYTNQIIAGLAKIRAAEIGTQLRGLAVWNGEPGDIGGTYDATTSWSELGIPLTYVELPNAKTVLAEHFDLRPVVPSQVPQSLLAGDRSIGDTRLMYLLFADAVGFSQLTDREIRLFMNEYLGRVADLLSPFTGDVPVRETVGDGLYLAFESIASAGAFTLALAEMVDQTDWQSLGFNTPLRLRAALHAGPVILCTDPVTGLLSAIGSHVSRAARLEPKTPPGLVYASEAFAALASVERNLPFVCRYVKQLEWAKRYGTFPTFLVTRS